MAQSRRSGAHVSGWAAAPVLLAPARAGEAWAPSSDHTIPAAGGSRSVTYAGPCGQRRRGYPRPPACWAAKLPPPGRPWPGRARRQAM
jgi:hypothetical protein